MPLAHVKAVLAVVLLVAAATALLSMLSLMGRPEHGVSTRSLRTTHRLAGYAFSASVLALAVLGVRMLSAAGDGLPVRSVIHWTAAVVLIVLLALKIAIARFYRQFLKFVPGMGFAVFTVAVLVAAVSLGFALVAGR